jgi:hypothetical protein
VKPLRILGGSLLGALALLAGCSEEVPTSSDPGLIPVQAETFEVLLPFEAFADGLRVDRGYGVAGDLPSVFVANDWADGLFVRPLFRFQDFPASVDVTPPGGSAQADSAWVPVEGGVVLFLDTLRVEGTGPFEFRLSQVAEEWDPNTATWTHAVDTLGDRRAWSAPGGGAVTALATGTWDPAEGDSLFLAVDSLTLREWRAEGGSGKGLLLESTREETRLRLRELALRMRVRSDLNPDTLVSAAAGGRAFTTLYTPTPAFGPEVIPVGGAPAHRSTFRFQLPESVEATGPVCRGAPSCQVALTADRVVYAGIRLTSIPTDPAGLAPADSMNLDVRPVLSPERLPRSPLGPPLRAQGTRLAPGYFAPGGSREVEVAMTRYLREVLLGEDARGEPVSGVLSLLTFPEPASLGVATFAGPGTEARPRLRIILTLSEGVTLP